MSRLRFVWKGEVLSTTSRSFLGAKASFLGLYQSRSGGVPGRWWYLAAFCRLLRCSEHHEGGARSWASKGKPPKLPDRWISGKRCVFPGTQGASNLHRGTLTADLCFTKVKGFNINGSRGG